MCNEIAHFTLTLIKLSVYVVENELYTLVEVRFQPSALDKFAISPRESATSCNLWANYTSSPSKASAVK